MAADNTIHCLNEKRVDFIVLATVVGVSLARSRVPLLPVPPRLPLRGAGGDRAISTPRLPMPAGWRLPPEAEVYSADVFCFAGHGVPFGIIFGGTDLNEDVNDGEKHQAMGRVLQEARYYDPRASQALDARPFWMQVHGNRDGGGQACGGLTPYHRSPLPPLRSFCFYFAR